MSAAQAQSYPRIFLCYRRHDSEFVTTTLSEKLKHAFGSAQVFQDIDDIPLGSDFDQAIAYTLQQCDITIVVIGAKWLRCDEPAYDVRNEKDYVRREVESALGASAQKVIPLLLDDVVFPLKADDIPPTLGKLGKNQAHRISTAPKRLHADLNAFVATLRLHHPPVQPPRKRQWVPYAIGLTALAALVAVVWLLWPAQATNTVAGVCAPAMRQRIEERYMAIEQQISRCRRPRDLIVHHGSGIYDRVDVYDSLSRAMVEHGKTMVQLIQGEVPFRNALRNTAGSAALVDAYDELWATFQGSLHDSLLFIPELPTTLNSIGLDISDAHECSVNGGDCAELKRSADARLRTWITAFNTRLDAVMQKKRAFNALLHSVCPEKNLERS